MTINIKFLSDVSKVVGDTKNLSENYDNVADSLKDLAKDSERAGDKMADSFDEAGDKAKAAGDEIGDRMEAGYKDAAGAAERFEDKVDAAFDAVGKDAAAAGDRISKSQRDGFKRAGDGAEEFRREADSTAKEAAASFDGSAESIADGFQEVAANAFAGFGPAGAAAGLAIAAGLGIGISKLQELADENDKVTEGIGELAEQFYIAGGALDEAAIAEKVREIAFTLQEEDVWYKWGDQSRTGVEMVREALDGIKDVDAGEVFRGLAGDVEDSQAAFDDLQGSIESDKEALEGMYRASAKGGRILTEEGEALQDSIEKREALAEKLHEATGASEEAAAATEYYTEAMGESTESIQARIEAQAELKDSNMSAAEAEIALAESTDKLSAELAEGAKTLDINTEAGRENRSAILDHVDAINSSTEASLASGDSLGQVKRQLDRQRESLLAQIRPFFDTKQAAREYIEEVLKTPREASTDVKLNGTAAREQELNHLARNRSTVIDVRANTDAAEYAIAMLNGRKVKVHVDAVPIGGQRLIQ